MKEQDQQQGCWSIPGREVSEDRGFLKKLDILSHDRKPCLEEKEEGTVEVNAYWKRFSKNLEHLAIIGRSTKFTDTEISIL